MIYTVFDIETSGLDKECDIYEFAYIRLDDNFNIIKSDTLYFFKKSWVVTASEIHGLTEEMLTPHIKDFYKNLAAMYATMHNGIAIGKNNMMFDNTRVISFINRNMYDQNKDKGIRDFRIEASIDVQNYMAPHYRRYMESIGQPVGPSKKGTLEDYMKVCGFDKPMLESFARQNGITVDERFKAHGAMYDTVMTLATLKWLTFAAKTVFSPK